jgi:ribosomal protein S18 acetylase RimI-like enzyme
MQAKDIEQVVFVHIKSFQGFFLTFLGRPFLKVLYSFIVFDKKSISIVVESSQENKIIGFVVGTLKPSGFYSRAIRRRLFSFAFASLPAFLRDPRIISRLLRALQKPREMEAVAADCELMSIAILPDYAHQGVGKALEAVFSNEAKSRNAHSITLTTDKLHNDNVNSFYERCDYMMCNNFDTPEGRQMNRYIKRLS